jgi:hypothetical protein
MSADVKNIDSAVPLPRLILKALVAKQAGVARFYDNLGIKEWLRLESDVRMRVIFRLHRSVLQ